MKSKEYLEKAGYGSGINYTTDSVANLMTQFSEHQNKELIEENARFKKGLQTIVNLGMTNKDGKIFLSGIANQTLKTNKK